MKRTEHQTTLRERRIAFAEACVNAARAQFKGNLGRRLLYGGINWPAASPKRRKR